MQNYKKDLLNFYGCRIENYSCSLKLEEIECFNEKEIKKLIEIIFKKRRF